MTAPTGAPEVAGRVARLSKNAKMLIEAHANANYTCGAHPGPVRWGEPYSGKADDARKAFDNLFVYIVGLELIASTAQRAVTAWFHDDGPTECEEWPAVVFDLRAAFGAMEKQDG